MHLAYHEITSLEEYTTEVFHEILDRDLVGAIKNVILSLGGSIGRIKSYFNTEVTFEKLH